MVRLYTETEHTLKMYYKKTQNTPIHIHLLTHNSAAFDSWQYTAIGTQPNTSEKHLDKIN